MRIMCYINYKLFVTRNLKKKRRAKLTDVLPLMSPLYCCGFRITKRGSRTFTILRIYDFIHDSVSCDLTFGCTSAPYVGAGAAVAYQTAAL